MPTHQELPEQFGRYRILKKLGAGGMGAVYLVEDAKLRRKVALKVPHFTPGTRAPVLERFQREARLAAAIDHPNFCPVHDVDEIDGIQFFTMTYVEGMPLADLGIHETAVSDLAILKGMPLEKLHFYDSCVTDLTPLQGMRLKKIGLTPKNITQGLDVLRDMKSLKTIGIGYEQDWQAVKFWERYDKGEFTK